MIETAFVSVAIFNNKGGADDVVRRRFEEPAWNYPVARFLAPDGAEIIPRKDRIWTARGFSARLVAALEAAEREVPPALRWATAALAERERATFAMHCFWVGEARLGALDGVLSTEAAWLDGREVVELEFDPSVIDYGTLLAEARRLDCLTGAFTRSDAQQRSAAKLLGDAARRSDERGRRADDDDKYHLRRGSLRFLPLTGFQATKCNAALAAGASGEAWLSPRQQALQARVAAALAADAQALAGLEAPTDGAGLWEHAARLEERLQALGR